MLMRGLTSPEETKSIAGKEIKEPKDAKIYPGICDIRLGAAAFAPVPETPVQTQKEIEAKEAKDFEKLYHGQEIIRKFPKSPQTVSVKPPSIIQRFLASTELYNNNQKFKTQFHELIRAIIAWISSPKCPAGVNKKQAVENFNHLFRNLFADEYAGNQPSSYFEEIKYFLEKFYLYYLCNDSIPSDIKAKRFNDLLPNLIVCAPGVYSHLQENDGMMTSSFSIEKSLAELRTLIVKRLADSYVFKKREERKEVADVKRNERQLAEILHPGNEPHVIISYMKLAQKLGINPIWKEVEDPFHVYTCLDGTPGTKDDFFNNPENPNRKKFENDFKDAFTSQTITTYLLDSINSAINEEIKSEISICNAVAKKANEQFERELKSGERSKLKEIAQLKSDGEYWPMNPKIFEIIKSVLSKAGIDLDEDLFEYKKGTHGKLKQDFLRHQLINSLIKSGRFKLEINSVAVKAENALLLLYVVQGEKDQVEAIVKKFPKLLFVRGVAIDYSGRTIEGTAYQMALGAEDVSRPKFPNEGMAEMLCRYFKQACDNDEKAAYAAITLQQKEQFPESYRLVESKRKKDDLLALSEAFDAIDVANAKYTKGDYFNSNGDIKLDYKCAESLDKFRDYLKPKHPIKNGKHFNIGLLIHAYELYERNFIKFGGDALSLKNIIAWRMVIGSILRYIPACYAQALCDIGNVPFRELNRSLAYCKDRLFFPLKPGSGLGYDYAAPVEEAPSLGYEFNRLYNTLGYYWRNKQSTLDGLLSNVPAAEQRPTLQG